MDSNSSCRFSGITPELLKDVTTTLEDARNEILKLVNDNDVLIGHSLENDLHALKLIHTTVVDTAVLFANNQRKRPLRDLSHSYLQRNIQLGSHDSSEDALASLDLAFLKFKFGAEFPPSTKV